MFKYIVSSLVLITLFTTCKKSGNGYVRGTVYEVGTGIPIEGAKVYVEDTKHGSTHHNSTGSAITDANGNYIIHFYKKATRRYFLYCNDDNHYNNFEQDITYKKTAITIELNPFAYIKLRLKKTSNSLNYVEANINGTNDINNIYKYYPNAFDTILPTVYKAIGNGINNISWYLYFNPVTTPNYNFYSSEFYLNKGDTLTYLIQFN